MPYYKGMNSNAVTNSQALHCMSFMLDLPGDELAAPLSILELVNDYELSLSPANARNVRDLTPEGRRAVYALRLAIAGWLVCDRTACVALLGPGLGIEQVADLNAEAARTVHRARPRRQSD